MKLSELVGLRKNLLETYNISQIEHSINLLCHNLSVINVDLDDKYTAYLGNTVKELQKILNDVNREHNNLDAQINQINHDINACSHKLFAGSYKTELTYNGADATRTVRVMHIHDQIYQIILSRIGVYSDWRYPTLEIGCRDGEWTQQLVAGDPLYIAERDTVFIDSVLKSLNAEYAKRIRPYHIKDSNFSILPQEQFGFVFSWNFFNYKSLESIKDYLKEVIKLLRPGGTFMFSYNNGDMPAGAAYAENFFMTYVPKSVLIPICEMLGYEVINSFDYDPAVCWIELKKPGTLNTSKAHQVLGTVELIDSI